MVNVRTLSLMGLVLLLSACGKDKSASTIDSNGQPVTETKESIGPESDPVPAAAPLPQDIETSASIDDAVVNAGATVGYVLPDFDSSWGMSRGVYDRAVTMMDMRATAFANQRFVGIIDFSKHSSSKRFFLFDLKTGKLEKHNVAHGSGSDPKSSGYAKAFSNQDGSLKSALGVYKTLGTYQGRHGVQLRLGGLEGTNSNALQRGIVLHGASYVRDGSRAGRSWGCPALDESVASSVISRMKNGSLLLIWK